MKSLMLKLAGAMMVMSLSLVPVAYADISSNLTGPACTDIKQASNVAVPGCSTKQAGVAAKGGLANEIVNTLLYAAAFISFVFILLGGFRYITATGDSGRIQSAKDTLMYAIIGLILSIIALPIAGFVITKANGK